MTADRHRGKLAGAKAELPRDILGPRPGKPAYLDSTQKWSRREDGEIVQSGTDRTHAQWLRQGELKYVRYFVANEPEELYDLSVDPDELVNKVDDPRYGSQLAALRRSWRDELRRSGADFLDAVVEP